MPKKYVEQVGDDGFKKHPIGAGPYRFVSFQPGVQLILEAHEKYWRKTPHVKRLVMKVVPEEPTRLAMLKKGEADIAYLMQGPIAEEIKRTRDLRLIPSGGQWVPAVCMLDQTDQALVNWTVVAFPNEGWPGERWPLTAPLTTSLPASFVSRRRPIRARA